MHDLTALENRLRKLLGPRQKWALKEGTDAFRLYEQDIPELRYIVDLYGEHAVVYDKRTERARESDQEETEHEDALLSAVTKALKVPAERVHLKRRKRISEREAQYTRLGSESVTLHINEGASRYKVNLSDYLDTGLFLDHRPLRHDFRAEAPGKRFLNLFCYTGSVSVAAAQGGSQTVSVDLSSTYLEWAQENFRLSALDPTAHSFIRADAREFLAQGPQGQARFDAIFLDPPSFSNSKKMAGTFDIQRDHRQLIAQTLKFLAPNGTLWFSTNFSKFALDPKVSHEAGVTDVTLQTIPEDFRNKTIHRCYKITQKLR